jgi:hypothetical protein
VKEFHPYSLVELSAGPSRRLLPGRYARIRRDATISIATLTVSENVRRRNWAFRYETLRLVVDASRLVMAIWSLSAIWDIPDRLPTEH